MKHLFAFVLAVMLMLSLCACGGSGDASSEPSQTSGVADTTQSTPESTPAAVSGVVYTAKLVSENGDPISGVMLQICDETCMPALTDAEGVATWNVPEENPDYHVSVTAMPEGYTHSGDETEFYYESGSFDLTITLKAAA